MVPLESADREGQAAGKRGGEEGGDGWRCVRESEGVREGVAKMTEGVGQVTVKAKDVQAVGYFGG